MTKLKAGDKAPAFTLESTQGKIKLSDLKGSWTILYFYPKDNTPGCTTEACNFRDALPGMNAKIIGISPDNLKSHQKFEADFGLPFPLASDPEHKVAEAYGTWGEKKNYGKTYMGIIRSTFIIDPKGNIAEALYNVKATGHVEKVKSILDNIRANGLKKKL